MLVSRTAEAAVT